MSDTRSLMIRYAALAVPLIALGLTWLATRGRRRDPRREAGALLLSFLAALIGLAVLNPVAVAAGWWSFARVDPVFGDVPVDLWIGWAVLWGPLPVALRRQASRNRQATRTAPGDARGRRLRLLTLLVGLGWFDVVTMPLLWPLLRLHAGWWIGELLGLLTVAVPVTLLGCWTADARRLRARVTGQVVLVGVLLLWFLPSVAIAAGDGSWGYLGDAPRWQLSLTAQTLLFAAVPGLAAVVEFAVRGGGTPYPWDPPPRLVTTGPYAYVANPMQLSATAILAVMAAVTRSWSVLAAAALVAVFSEAVAAVHERDDLDRRHGQRWRDYRREIPRWWPRWYPYRHQGGPALLHVDAGCDRCRALGDRVDALPVTGLAVTDARRHPEAVSLRRVTYTHPDGLSASGVAAVARVLEHVHLGYAVLGWLLRLPVVGWLATALADGSGLGPRPLSSAPDSGGGPGAGPRAPTVGAETRWWTPDGG